MLNKLALTSLLCSPYLFSNGFLMCDLSVEQMQMALKSKYFRCLDHVGYNSSNSEAISP